MRRLAPAVFVLLLGCGNCQIDSDPIPGGFDPAARIERAAQVRLTESGLDVLEVAAEEWVLDAALLSCAGDADCPAVLGASCTGATCSGGSYVAIDLPSGNAGAFDVCTTGSCRVHLAIDTVGVEQAAPSSLVVTLGARLASTDIPVRDLAGGADCTARLDAQGPAPIAVELAMAPSSSGRIGLTVAGVSLPPLSLSGSCGAALGADLRAAIEAASIGALRDLTASAVGERCEDGCPAGATCSAERCFEGDQILLPGLDEEQRITVPPVLDAYDTPDAVSDLALQVGGAISADATGLTAGVRAGMELVTPNPQCANVLPSPRLRPSFVAPEPIPSTDSVDLDFDGTDETPYGLALSLSKAFLDQVIWSAYGGGLLCGALSTEDSGGIHTGTLEIIIPSVRFLTKSHLAPRSERPARISAWLRTEPEIRIGSGETVESSGNVEYVDPLVHLFLRDFEINLSALIEERWVRILTATIDLHLGVAMMVTPANEIEPIIGVGVQEIISNVRITNHELLQEDPAAIAQALPTLLSFALLEFAGSAGQFPIPTLEGTDLDVLGIRGVPGANGFDHLAIYADLLIAAGGNLSSAAETEARLVQVRTPRTEEFAVGAMKLPEVELALGGSGAGELEWQARVDGGFWSPFTSRDSIVISRPELAIQGLHRVELRARVRDDYRSLDPTPAAIDFWIDSEPPHLELKGRELFAFDRVSRDRITVEAIDSDGVHAVALDGDGRATLERDVRAVRATDRAGLVTEISLVEASRVDPQGSGCTGVEGDAPALGLVLLAALALVIRRRAA